MNGGVQVSTEKVFVCGRAESLSIGDIAQVMMSLFFPATLLCTCLHYLFGYMLVSCSCPSAVDDLLILSTM